jgi:hypothetical protein
MEAKAVNTPWIQLLRDDPVPWLLHGEEPAARWLTLAAVLRVPQQDRDLRRAHAAVLTDATTCALLERLPDWEAGERFSGHDSPAFAPNLLNLLADMGVRGGELPEVERLLDQMLSHQEPNGRFPSYAAMRGSDPPEWGALLCDSHAVTEALVRLGRGNDPRVRRSLERMAADVADTTQGRAWPCLPHSSTNWRGPGRKGEFCPMVTLQALRTFAHVPQALRPPGLLECARVPLRAWRMRGQEKPYIFGHGRAFKTVKWPPTWYSALAVLDALAGYPQLRSGAGRSDQDRRALAELLACLIAYNIGPDGRVTPRSAYRSIGSFSFGQKKRPSAFATARVLATLSAYDDLVDEVAAVDVTSLPSSKGGAGTAVPPPTHKPAHKPAPRTSRTRT